MTPLEQPGVATISSPSPAEGAEGEFSEAAQPPGPGGPPGEPPGEAAAELEVAQVPDRYERPASILLTLGVLVASAWLVWANLHPGLVLDRSTTAAGGDMGAHVLAPAYLRDHLLPQFRLTGWTPDWYAGFPAYQFYMVVPALVIVACSYVFGYAVGFKLVTVAGLVAMPFCAALMARLFRLPAPGPALVGLATVPFLWDNTWTIYGGNVASNLAGEFSFTLSQACALVFLGLLARGLQTGRYRGRTAVLFALVALCHPLPLLGFVTFGIAGLALWQTVAVLAPSPGADGAVPWRLRLRALRSSVWFGISTLGIGSLLTAFWILPFVGRGAYLNDMGWQRLEITRDSVLVRLFHLGKDGVAVHGLDRLGYPQIQWWLAMGLAVVGILGSLVLREKLGVVLTVTAISAAALFVLLPQGRFWNARVLPFYYLSIYLLAGVGATLIVRGLETVARSLSIPRFAVRLPAVVFGTVFVLLLVSLPLGTLGRRNAAGLNEWDVGVAQLRAKSNFVKAWAHWNYSGYEGKAAYPEYREVIDGMAGIGRDHGCGRAMWEYDNDRLNSYGTPMSLMLLPYWTDGCIGSMEGLYFESSATTPYHFLNQSELSARPSRPQQDLPYRDLDVSDGVDHLQLFGVKYYLAFSERVVAAARAQPDLRELASFGGDPLKEAAARDQESPDPDAIDRTKPWVVFEVLDSPIVQPLDRQPFVVEGIGEAQEEWLEPAAEFHNDPTRWDAFPAADGPTDWPRATLDEDAPDVAVEPATVSRVDVGRQTITFDVDRVGSPVLVKASYFPNWKVDGAQGPYRVMPNLMVVVPTETTVRLHYGYTPLDAGAYGLSALGLVGLAALAARRRGLLTLPVPAPASPDQLFGPGDDGELDWSQVSMPTEAPAPGSAPEDGSVATEAVPGWPAGSERWTRPAEPDPPDLPGGAEPLGGAGSEVPPPPLPPPVTESPTGQVGPAPDATWVDRDPMRPSLPGEGDGDGRS